MFRTLNDMSTSENRVSEKEQEGQVNDSVYDFLYHDVRRVGSFLAQFDEAGYLQQLKQTEGVARSYSRSTRFAATGSIPLVGSANLDASRTPTDSATETSERVYDPLWTNARTLLDYLAEREMLERDLSAARIGQFVLVAGELAILDVPVLRQLWELPIVRSSIRSGVPAGAGIQIEARNRAERRKENRQQQQKRETTIEQDPVEFILQTVKYLPHAIQATLTANNHTAIWCSIREDSLVGSSADLMLKHGAILSGTWHIVGILDALPEVGESDVPIAAALGNSPLAQAAQSLAPIVRQMMGRPAHAYGLTPLLIFRQISV
jgi:hypothetical protein